MFNNCHFHENQVVLWIEGFSLPPSPSPSSSSFFSSACHHHITLARWYVLNCQHSGRSLFTTWSSSRRCPSVAASCSCSAFSQRTSLDALSVTNEGAALVNKRDRIVMSKLRRLCSVYLLLTGCDGWPSVSLLDFGATSETHLWVSLRKGVQHSLTEVEGTHPDCDQHHPVGWVPQMSKNKSSKHPPLLSSVTNHLMSPSPYLSHCVGQPGFLNSGPK